MKLKVNDKMPDFSYDTAFEQGLSYHEKTKGKKAVLVFLRYFGCTMCQLDLLDFEESYDKFEERGIDLKIVLQSSRENMVENLKEKEFSYDIICDPNEELYKKFEIDPAKSMLKLAGVKVVGKVLKAKKAGIEHGEYEGNELQLPAIFIMDEDSNILYAHYGKNGADIPDAIEVLKLVE